MKPRLFFWTLCLLAILFVFSTPAQAHRPIWGDSLGPIEIEDISVSYAFYQKLNASEIDVFYFEGKQGENFHAGIQIPDITAYKDYSVMMALFGPGLPAPDEAHLPPEYPEGLGALIVPTEVTDEFFEPITRTTYLGRQKLDMILPADGQYYIIIWQSKGEAGKYVMDVGQEEEFGLPDLFALPVWWVRVHWYFEHFTILITLAVLIVTANSVLVFRRLRQKQSTLYKE